MWLECDILVERPNQKLYIYCFLWNYWVVDFWSKSQSPSFSWHRMILIFIKPLFLNLQYCFHTSWISWNNYLNITATPFYSQLLSYYVTVINSLAETFIREKGLFIWLQCKVCLTSWVTSCRFSGRYQLHTYWSWVSYDCRSQVTCPYVTTTQSLDIIYHSVLINNCLEKWE